MSEAAYRRIIYKSMAQTGATVDDHDAILTQSRVNNGIDGLSGLLCADGGRYIQLLEGPPESVAITFARIMADPRHDQIIVISDTIIN